MGARYGGRAAVAARLAALPPLSDVDGHFLAGLLDAEASFLIGPNNGGRNWQCSMNVKLRRDDAPILADLQTRTGIGTLTAVPARRTSKPQISWCVTSGLECMRLGEILEEFPMYGRKRFEVADWITAVRILNRGTSRSLDIAELATRIRSRRLYVDPGRSPPHPQREPSGFRLYFGGFFTGEGCFLIGRDSARAVIKLRRDDRALLAGFEAIFRLGRVYDAGAYGTANPSSAWMIVAQRDLPPACQLLEDARLRGRKAREFRVWREAAAEFGASQFRPRNHGLVERAAGRLRATRSYVHCDFAPTGDDRDAVKHAYVALLRSWASETSGALSGTKYAEDRQVNWPTRNTIAGEFGSWHAALEAAGLAHRAARGPRPQRACSASIPTTAASTRRRSSVRPGSPVRSMS
jgi:hypothetical protein